MNSPRRLQYRSRYCVPPLLPLYLGYLSGGAEDAEVVILAVARVRS